MRIQRLSLCIHRRCKSCSATGVGEGGVEFCRATGSGAVGKSRHWAYFTSKHLLLQLLLDDRWWGGGVAAAATANAAALVAPTGGGFTAGVRIL